MSQQNRQLSQVITGQQTSDGAGVKLTRIINPQQKLNLDPFILFDEFGSNEVADYIGGFPPHPHRGFETVTYMLEGAMVHRDHLGNEGHLRAGDVQWMTAAHGIIHSEMPEQEQGRLHGFQLWLNLPAKEKMKAPSYQDIAAAAIPVVTLTDGSSLKLIAGCYEAADKKMVGAVTGGVSTQPLYVDVLLNSEHAVNLKVPANHTVLVYVYAGELSVDKPDKILTAGQLGQLTGGDNIHLQAITQTAKCLVIAAQPLNEPVVQAGPFVMNTYEEIEQAYRDFRDGVLTTL